MDCYGKYNYENENDTNQNEKEEEEYKYEEKDFKREDGLENEIMYERIEKNEID